MPGSHTYNKVLFFNDLGKFSDQLSVPLGPIQLEPLMDPHSRQTAKPSPTKAGVCILQKTMVVGGGEWLLGKINEN